MNYVSRNPEAYYTALNAPVKKQRKYVRAILLAWFVAFLLSIVALTSASAFAPAAASNVSEAAIATDADTFYVTKVNTLRAEKGLKPVRLLVELNESSNDKVIDMVANNYWSHFAPNNGPSFSDIIWKRVPPAQLVGENLARCFATRDAAFTALVASKTHYEIMIGNFNYIGISEAFDSNTNCTVMAMHFAQI